MKTTLLYFALMGALLAAPTKKEAPVKISGEAFAKGIDQPYKFAGLHLGIYAFTPTPGIDEPMPTALVEATADSDGRFTIESPGKSYILYARAERSYRTGSRAVYEWTIILRDLRSLEHVALTGENAKITPRVQRFSN